MIRMNDFLDAFKNEKQTRIVRYATIADGYTTGRPHLVFDGETAPTGKAYAKLKSYTPIAGERVVVINDLVMGAVE